MTLIEEVARRSHSELEPEDIHHLEREVVVEAAVVAEVGAPEGLVVVVVAAFDVVVLDVVALVIVVVEGPNLGHLVLLPLCHQIGPSDHDRWMELVAKGQHWVLVDPARRYQLGEAELLLEPQAHGVDVQSLPRT
jgi:hypothetical protein